MWLIEKRADSKLGLLTSKPNRPPWNKTVLSSSGWLLAPGVEWMRRFVIRSCLSSALRVWYQRAALRMVDEVSNVAGALCVLARNSFADSSYTPGASDIDLTIVLKDDPSLTRQAVSQLDRIRRRLRTFYPMLDDFSVYTLSNFQTAFQLGPLQAENYAWRCLWGDDVRPHISTTDQGSKTELTARAVQAYLTGYQENLSAALSAGRTTTTLPLERSTRKLQTALRPLLAWTVPTEQSRLISSVSATLSVVTTVARGTPTETAAPNWEYCSDNDSKQTCERNELPLPPSLQSVVAAPDPGSVWCMLEEQTDPEGLSTVFQRVQSSFPRRRVAVLSGPVFEFYLRNINPSTYFYLSREREVWGQDLLQLVKAPTNFGVRRFIVQEVCYFLRTPLTWKSRVEADRRRLARLLHFLNSDQFVLSPHIPTDFFTMDPLQLRSEWGSELRRKSEEKFL